MGQTLMKNRYVLLSVLIRVRHKYPHVPTLPSQNTYQREYDGLGLVRCDGDCELTVVQGWLCCLPVVMIEGVDGVIEMVAVGGGFGRF